LKARSPPRRPIFAQRRTSSAATSVEGIADYLVKAWKPTGYYTPDQMASILNQCEKIYFSVVTPIRAYIAEGLSFAKDVAHALDNKMNLDGYQGFIMRNRLYVNDARAKGIRYINAPGFRRQTTDFLYLMSNGVDGLAIIKRVNEEEWGRLPLAREILSVTRTAATAIVKIAGVAFDVVKAAGQAVLEIPDTARTLFTVVKWGTIAYVGFWLYQQLRPRAA